MPSTDLLTAREVAESFRVSIGTVARWRRDNLLPGIKVGRTVRFHRADVLRLLEPQDLDAA